MILNLCVQLLRGRKYSLIVDTVGGLLVYIVVRPQSVVHPLLVGILFIGNIWMTLRIQKKSLEVVFMNVIGVGIGNNCVFIKIELYCINNIREL